jgi:hypothetical protein
VHRDVSWLDVWDAGCIGSEQNGTDGVFVV